MENLNSNISLAQIYQNFYGIGKPLENYEPKDKEKTATYILKCKLSYFFTCYLNSCNVL